jgi:hypothetical protein
MVNVYSPVTTIRQVKPGDFEKVLPLFQGFATHSQVNPDDWRKIFSAIWSGQEPSFGYILEDHREAVGFLGTLFSTRMIRNTPREFCNLTSWIVKPEYRAESLSLLFPLLSRKKLTLTNFTASNRVISVLQKIGFKSLEDHYFMLLPYPVPLSGCKLILNPDEMKKMLEGEDLCIHQDHRNLHCIQVVMETPGGILFIILNPARKKNLPVLFVDYLNDPELFNDFKQRCVFAICRQFKVYGLMIGAHSLRGRSPRFGLRITRRHSLLYRSNEVAPEDIDTLYSEIQVLGLKPV